MSMPDLWSPAALAAAPTATPRRPKLSVVRREATLPAGPWGSNHFMPFPWLAVRYAKDDEVSTAREIIADTAAKHGMTSAMMVGRSRTRKFVEARREAAERLFASGRNVTEIGRMFHRDHTTIMCLLGFRDRKNGHYYERRRDAAKAREAEGK